MHVKNNWDGICQPSEDASALLPVKNNEKLFFKEKQKDNTKRFNLHNQSLNKSCSKLSVPDRQNKSTRKGFDSNYQSGKQFGKKIWLRTKWYREDRP
jgi:hypothetical protein